MTDREIQILKIAKEAIDAALLELPSGQYCCESCAGLRRAQNKIVELLSSRQILRERWALIATK